MLLEYSRMIISFIFVLGVLVIFHEFGHYLAARWRGVHVDVFSVGFGKKLFSWEDRLGTEWRVCAFPFGGYVKPHGFNNPDFASPEEKASFIEGKTFHDKPVLSRIIVVIAGPLFNFLLAYILFVLLLCTSGRPQVHNEIAKIVPNGGAAVAGLMPKDFIIGIDHKAMSNVDDIHQKISSSPGKTLNLEISRQGHHLDIPVTVGDGKVKGQQKAQASGQIGIIFAVSKTKPLGFFPSLKAGALTTWDITVKTLDGVWQMLTGRHTAKDLGGPLKIAQISGEVSHYGFAALLALTAVLSVNLGLINLFPVPVLDGGHLIFFLIEAARGRPISTKVQQICLNIGFLLLAALFLFSTFNDLSSFGLFKWVNSLFG